MLCILQNSVDVFVFDRTHDKYFRNEMKYNNKINISKAIKM